MKYLKLVFLSILPHLVFSQIGRELKSIKINGNYVQLIEKIYKNVKINREGVPIVPKKPMEEILYLLEDGYNIEMRCYNFFGMKKKLLCRVSLDRSGSMITGAELFAYSKGKEFLFRSHTAIVRDGKLVSEKIMNNGKVIGTAHYSYGVKNEDIKYEIIELININKIKSKIYTESDDQGILFSRKIIESDTILTLKRIETQGDSIKKSIMVSKNRKTNKADSVLLIERTWFDFNKNPTMVLEQRIVLTEPAPGEPKSMNSMSTFSYLDSDNMVETKSPILATESLYGAWRNEANNIELFFEPKRNGKQRFYGFSYLGEKNGPTVEQFLSNNTIWIFMLKQEFNEGSWVLNNDGTIAITIPNGSILTFFAVLDNKTLVLKPKIKNMKGELRLNSSN